MNIKKFLVASAAGALMFGSLAVGAFASNVVIYNNIPSNLFPGNLPSEAFEAQSASEFGGQVSFADTLRSNPVVTVVMSSWGCESGHWYPPHDCVTTPGLTFSHPVTLNIYNVNGDNSPGTLIKSVTKTFDIPYRPSADNVNCTGDNAGKWYNGSTCFNGFATPITFDLTGTTLPDNVIISVAYNTTHYGSSPIGESAPCFTSLGGCGYDSLNVAVTAPPTVGTDPLPSSAYLNSSWSGAYCSGSTGTFRLDGPCWTGNQPAFKVEVPGLTPTNMDQCKKDGWKTFSNPTFKNQGQCVSYVQANEHAGKQN